MNWKLPETPKIATGIIIEYEGGVVLIDRKFPPYGLAIPGGFHELGLSLEANAIKEGKEETGLDVLIQ
ncbi:MAG: NUDIX hydrolase, partial [Nanoarchaeota archaeon]|nr:NUDIX hydrolase [Nanoarchaeota archaeon]